MLTANMEKRRDLWMRRFVGKIIDYLMQGGDHANARLNMIEIGIPPDVQRRVLHGLATRR